MCESRSNGMLFFATTGVPIIMNMPSISIKLHPCSAPLYSTLHPRVCNDLFWSPWLNSASFTFHYIRRVLLIRNNSRPTQTHGHNGITITTRTPQYRFVASSLLTLEEWESLHACLELNDILTTCCCNVPSCCFLELISLSHLSNILLDRIIGHQEVVGERRCSRRHKTSLGNQWAIATLAIAWRTGQPSMAWFHLVDGDFDASAVLSRWFEFGQCWNFKVNILWWSSNWHCEHSFSFIDSPRDSTGGLGAKMVEYVLSGSPTTKDSPLGGLEPRLSGLKFEDSEKVLHKYIPVSYSTCF